MLSRDAIIRWAMHLLGTVPEPLYSWLNALANRWVLFRNPETVEHWGSLHPGKTFYVIRDLPNYVGVAGWFDAVLGYMLYADKKGWIPVVDPPPPAQTDDGDWSAYFVGPNAEYWPQLKELANVVVAHPRGLIHKRYNRNNVARRHAIVPRVPFTDELQSFVDDGLAKLFAGAPEGMVGVRFRGTDYRCHGTYRPTGHATVPTIEYFCQELERSLRKWGLGDVAGEHLLIVTEE